jgi:hypothetical protein
MGDLLELMNEFELRNNISTTIKIHSDGSGSLEEFWDNEGIISFENSSELRAFLANGKLKMKDGRSVKPIKIAANYRIPLTGCGYTTKNNR